MILPAFRSLLPPLRHRRGGRNRRQQRCLQLETVRCVGRHCRSSRSAARSAHRKGILAWSTITTTMIATMTTTTRQCDGAGHSRHQRVGGSSCHRTRMQLEVIATAAVVGASHPHRPASASRCLCRHRRPRCLPCREKASRHPSVWVWMRTSAKRTWPCPWQRLRPRCSSPRAWLRTWHPMLACSAVCSVPLRQRRLPHRRWAPPASMYLSAAMSVSDSRCLTRPI